MDHLPFPQGTRPPTVSFVATDYDDGQFSSYPQRQGMDSDLRTSSFDRLSPEEYQAFFQTWLYFGCLTQVFKIAGLSADPTRFRINKGNLVTSACLNAYLDEWKHQEAARRPEKRRRAILYPIRDILRTVQNVLQGPAQAFRRFVDEHKPDSSVRASWPNIALSIAALGYTFQRVSDLLYAPVSDQDQDLLLWGSAVSWALQERMEHSQWCKALIAKFLADKALDFILFISSTTFPRTAENHDECTGTVCRGRISHADSENYQTKHVTKSCKCEMCDMPSASLEIIDNKGIPLACWSDEKGLQVLKYQADMPYVAISHVWADGKGNPKRNALPRCQLEAIQNKIKDLYAVPRREGRPPGLMFGPWQRHGPRDPHRQPVGFWMDTLCVPVGEEDELKRLRKKTIGQMREIYETADRVLVLDDRIEQLALSSRIYDRAARLVVSNWQSRIWTLQEGVMAQQLFFRFSDGTVTLDELEEEEVRQRDKSGPSPGFWHRVSHDLLTLLSISLVFEEEKRPGVDELFEALVPVAGNRMTTKYEDETICLATLLRLDTQQIGDIRSKYSSQELREMPEEKRLAEEMLVCDERMKKFLCMIGRFHKSLIFNELPRLLTNGFRWAPRSFLGQSGATVAHDNPERVWEGWEEPASILYRGENGVLKSHDGSVDAVVPKRVLGLLVAYPGIMLHSISRSLIRTGQFYVREVTHMRYQYRVTFDVTKPLDTSQLDEWEGEEDRYALVTVASVDSEDESPIAAIFGIFKGVARDGIRQFHSLFLAKVEVVDWRGSRVDGADEDGSEEAEGWEDDDSVKGMETDEVIDENSHNKDEHKGVSADKGDEDDEDDDGDGDWEDDEDSDSLDAEEDEQAYQGGYSEAGESEEEDSSRDDDHYVHEDKEDNGSDDRYVVDSDSDSDGEDDDYTTRNTQQPRSDEIVYGKLLFSRNNKWCII